MKRTYLAVLFTIVLNHLSAQSFEWAKGEGLWAYDYGYGIATDNGGNVYVAGKYEYNAEFSGTVVNCEGNHDSFLAKYNPDGSLNWIRTSGGGLGDYAHAIACDASNYVYIAGEIEGNFGDTISFQGSPVTLTAKGDNDIFLAKYDLSGNLIWAKSAGGYDGEKALGVTYDNSGNVYICGQYKTGFDYEGTIVANAGERDLFVAKYDAAGNFQWVQNAGGPGREEALSIRCDASGNVYVCGMHSDNAVFGTSTLTSPLGYVDAFLAKYAPDGTLLWVRSDGSDYSDVGWSLTIDNSGKIYVAGEYNAYAEFDSYAITSMGMNADIYVACYDASGTVQWLSNAGGTYLNRARGIGTDGTHLYITGQFGGTAIFGSYTVNAVDSSDIFIASLDNSGNFRWAVSVGGPVDSIETLGYESGNAVHADPAGYVYATGGLLTGGIFGATTCAGYQRTDIFVTKIAQIGADIPESNSDIVSFYPNPSQRFFKISGGNSLTKADICIRNCLGQVIQSISTSSISALEIDLEAYEKGIYFVEIYTEEGLFREKILKQ